MHASVTGVVPLWRKWLPLTQTLSVLLPDQHLPVYSGTEEQECYTVVACKHE